MEATSSSKILVANYWTTWHAIAEENNLEYVLSFLQLFGNQAGSSRTL
jgi:hypothetical protein